MLSFSISLDYLDWSWYSRILTTHLASLSLRNQRQSLPFLLGTLYGHGLSSPFSSCLFQYIADLLLCSPFFSDRLLDATSLFNFLSFRGYHLTPSKAQFSFPQVNYLKFSLTPTYGYFTLNYLAHLCSLSLSSWPISFTHVSLDTQS